MPDPNSRQFPNIAADDNILVGAYWYPWFGADRRHWNEGYLGTPTLGEYDMTQPEVLDRHIDWATGHGIDLFAASWWGRDSFEDEVLRVHLPAAALGSEIQFAVLYESAGLLKQQDGHFDLDDAANRRQFVDDVRYLAETFFSRPNYLRIDGRPVLFVYLTRIFSGDVAGAFDQVRAAVREIDGHDLYIVGDEVYWGSPDAKRLSWFDAVTAYNMHTSAPNIEVDFAQNVIRQYEWWAQATKRANITLVPGVLPGFDDTAVRPRARHPVIGRSPALFVEQLKGALDIARRQPVPMVMITSWNEWHEYTSVEPAEEYGFEYLELLRAALNQP
ncbi:MAG: glycoside hydrolase family 99-like domain-containing protein [Anaerolineae bacterium]|nr:glycoside hydrolase family 99-like domain-containing protein [Anaerolineae bacterium]